MCEPFPDNIYSFKSKDNFSRETLNYKNPTEINTAAKQHYCFWHHGYLQYFDNKSQKTKMVVTRQNHIRISFYHINQVN